MGIKRYDKSFKERAVKLSYERSSVLQASRELWVSDSQLSKWRKEFAQYGANSFPCRGIERLTDEQQEIKRLQTELKDKELDIEILKSSKFVKLLNDNKISQSMSGKGNCWDNAVAESFFKTIKSEIIYGFSLVNAEKLRNKVFTWVECWYNKSRCHSALNNLTIDEFWRKYNSENGINTPKRKRKNINNKFPNLLCG